MESLSNLCARNDATTRRIRRNPRTRSSPTVLFGLFLLGTLLPPSPLSLHRITQVSGESSTIPRSTNRYSNYPADTDSPPSEQAHHPPWNPSPQISSTGYLSHLYPRAPGAWEPLANLRGRHGPKSKHYNSLSQIPVRIRQVPGDGNCLFHSIAVGLHRIENGTDLCMDSPRSIHSLRLTSLNLRNRAVDTLLSHRRKLFLQGEEYLEARELLMAAASQFDLGGEEYCELMRRESYWGGGPEIVALCNWLQRPIHIYELVPTEKSDETQSSTQQTTSLPLSTQFTLRRMACFGSPKFDRKEPLHILSADSRFPDIEPSRIRKVGNHFLALFPVEKSGGKGSGVLRRALVRGGENKLVENAVVRKSDDDNVVVEDAKRADRWDGGRGRWSARSADSVIVGEALGVERFVRRIERTMGSSMQWIMSRLVGFVAMSEVR